MPRTSRAIVAGHCYHVLNRGNNRMRLFHDRADYIAVLWLLAESLAGLHYAHELAVDGSPLQIVHRDFTPQNLFVTYDGHSGYPLQEGDIVRVRRSERTLKLVKAPRSYFELLREKLKWGERGGRE